MSRLPYLFEVRPARIVGCGVAEHQLDEAENYGQVVTERVHGRRIEPAPFRLSLHGLSLSFNGTLMAPQKPGPQ